MVVEHTKRTRRTDEERAQDLRDQLAKIDEKRARTAKALAAKIIEELRILSKSPGIAEGDEIKIQLGIDATRLEQWIARQA